MAVDGNADTDTSVTREPDRDVARLPQPSQPAAPERGRLVAAQPHAVLIPAQTPAQTVAVVSLRLTAAPRPRRRAVLSRFAGLPRPLVAATPPEMTKKAFTPSAQEMDKRATQPCRVERRETPDAVTAQATEAVPRPAPRTPCLGKSTGSVTPRRSPRTIGPKGHKIPP